MIKNEFLSNEIEFDLLTKTYRVVSIYNILIFSIFTFKYKSIFKYKVIIEEFCSSYQDAVEYVNSPRPKGQGVSHINDK